MCTGLEYIEEWRNYNREEVSCENIELYGLMMKIRKYGFCSMTGTI